jgi:hypothetical protein
LHFGLTLPQSSCFISGSGILGFLSLSNGHINHQTSEAACADCDGAVHLAHEVLYVKGGATMSSSSTSSTVSRGHVGPTPETGGTGAEFLLVACEEDAFARFVWVALLIPLLARFRLPVEVTPEAFKTDVVSSRNGSGAIGGWYDCHWAVVSGCG